MTLDTPESRLRQSYDPQEWTETKRFWLRESIGIAGLGLFVFVCLWVFPLVLEGMQ